MKTIKYKEIDGLFIYDGFDILPADPAETHKRADSLFQETEICKRMSDKSKEKENHWVAHIKSMRAAKILKAQSDNSFKQQDNTNFKKFKAEQKKAEKEANDRVGAANICNEELIEMRKEADALKMQLRKENIVYAPGPRKNEALGDSADIDAVILADMQKPANTVIALDLEMINEIIIEADEPAGTGERQEYRQYKLNSGSVETVPDFRGKQYFYKADGVWVESEVITTLGVTKETVVVDEYQEMAIEKADLTAEQLEEIRIQNLTEIEKNEEYGNKYFALVSRAAAMKTENEIIGKTAEEALAIAQNWLAGEVATLKTIYGVS